MSYALGLRITRGMLPCLTRASCTDSRSHRTDSTRGAGIIRRAGPRAVHGGILASVHPATVRNATERRCATLPTGGRSATLPRRSRAAAVHAARRGGRGRGATPRRRRRQGTAPAAHRAARPELERTRMTGATVCMNLPRATAEPPAQLTQARASAGQQTIAALQQQVRDLQRAAAVAAPAARCRLKVPVR